MNPYTTLARQTIENYIKTGKEPFLPLDLPSELIFQKGGVFVTIRKGKELRGCVGTISATKDNIALEIISNAISAAIRDYRFTPITGSELPELNYEVSILSASEAVKGLADLDVEKYGVIVRTSDGRSGLLLPNLEGVDNVDEQVRIAAEKGGIDPEKEVVSLYRFTTEVFTETQN